MNPDAQESRTCRSCQGTGETPTDYGIVDCPDCGGGGLLPTRAVLIDWRARDIERALSVGQAAEASDVQWLLAELRSARIALTEIVALSHDANDPDAIAQKIRFAGNRALGLYEVAAEARKRPPTDPMPTVPTQR